MEKYVPVEERLPKELLRKNRQCLQKQVAKVESPMIDIKELPSEDINDDNVNGAATASEANSA